MTEKQKNIIMIAVTILAVAGMFFTVFHTRCNRGGMPMGNGNMMPGQGGGMQHGQNQHGQNQQGQNNMQTPPDQNNQQNNNQNNQSTNDGSVSNS